MVDTLRDDLEKAFEENEDDAAAARSAATASDDDASKTTVPEPDAADKSDAKTEKADPKTEPKTEPAKAPGAKATGKADGADPKFSYRDPPARWSKEAKEAWAKAFGDLDPANPTHKQIGTLRDMMFQRQEEAERTLQERETELTTKLKEFDGLVKVMAPHVPGIRSMGQEPEAFLGNLLQINRFATDRPDEFVKWFIEQRQLDPAKLFGSAQRAAPGSPEGDDDDPLGLIPKRYKDALSIVPQLQQTIAALQQQVGTVGQQFGTFQQQAQQAQRTQAGTYIQQWSSATDEGGNPMRPHYANQAVREEMIRLIDSGIETDLDKAYDRAVWAIPETREHVLNSQSARAAAERERKAREEASRKRNAAVSINGRSPTVAPSSGGDASGLDLRGALSKAWDDVVSG